MNEDDLSIHININKPIHILLHTYKSTHFHTRNSVNNT